MSYYSELKYDLKLLEILSIYGTLPAKRSLEPTSEEKKMGEKKSNVLNWSRVVDLKKSLYA